MIVNTTKILILLKKWLEAYFLDVPKKQDLNLYYQNVKFRHEQDDIYNYNIYRNDLSIDYNIDELFGLLPNDIIEVINEKVYDAELKRK